MIPGATVVMGDTEWTIPPLTLGQLRLLTPKVRDLQTIGATMTEQEIDLLIDIVTAAMQRNYPEITAERVGDLLDLGNAFEVWQAVLAASRLRPREGEAPAVAARPNGEISTASSPPPADTATLQ
jgi:alkylhydroperoxidase/carboxymuconolactone decarboxylase family protein YurZ